MDKCDTCMYGPLDEICNYCSEEYSKWASNEHEQKVYSAPLSFGPNGMIGVIPIEPTPKYYDYTYKGIKLDPYRICEVYSIGGGPREQIIKKCLRFTDKGQEPLDVIKEIRQALDRWEEMVKEDRDAM